MYTSISKIIVTPPPPPEYVVAKWNFICRFVEEKQMCKKIVGFCDKISNSDSSATIYRLASFEIYVKWEIWNVWKTDKFLSLLIYLNRKWHFWTYWFYNILLNWKTFGKIPLIYSRHIFYLDTSFRRNWIIFAHLSELVDISLIKLAKCKNHTHIVYNSILKEYCGYFFLDI